MVKHSNLKVMAFAFTSFALMSVTSCVNEKYDMSEDNLNLEVTPFQDGLVLPIGNTDTLKLKELLKDLDADVLQTLENGAYAVRFNDSFNMSEELASLTDMVNIDDVEFSRKVNFELNSADVSDVKVEEMDYSFDYDISSSFKAPELTLPSVSENLQISAGLARYAPDPDQMALKEFPSVSHETHLMSLNDSFHIPDAMINDNPVAVDGALLAQNIHITDEFDGTQNIHLYIELPKGISSVEDIVLHSGAKMKVTLELRNSFLLSGKLIPQIDVDLHNIFHLDKNHSDDHAHLDDDFVLSEKNNYKQTVEYSITSLAINPKDWERKNADSPCVLDKDYLLPAKGGILLEDLHTTTRLLENNRQIDLYMQIEFVDLQIDDVIMTVDPVTVSQSDEVSLTMDDLELPEEVEEFTEVIFTENSGFNIDIKAENVSRIRGLKADLESLVLTFPEEIQVEGANARNQVIYSNVDLSKGLSDNVRITGIEMPAPVGGKIVFSENIKVEAVAKADGTIHSADLPARDADDVKVLVDVRSDLVVKDYEVKVKGFEYELDIEPEVISVELPEDMLDLGDILITPEGNPEISIDIQMPEMDMDLIPSDAGGLCLDFPDMFVFKTPLPAEYNFNATDNSITLRGSFPEQITLPVEKLWLVPQKDETDGKVYAKGEVSLTGGLSVDASLMNKEQIEQITAPGMKVSVKAHIPELIPSKVALDKFETRISEKIDIDLMPAEDMPKEIVSIGRIELDDVYLNLMLDASSLPDLGSTKLSLDFTVGFPDMIEVSGVETDEAGNIKLNGTVNKDGQIKVDPVKIEALNLEGVNIENGIKDVIDLAGSVTLTDASLDVNEWLGKELEVEFKADIKDIDIAKVTGKVDYKVDPVVEAVDLSEFAESLGSAAEEAELDFNHVHLALEVNTNLGVPVNAEISLVPYYNGAPDEKKAVSVPVLALKYAESADKTAVTKYWLANPGSEDRCPAGYEFVEADILSLLRDIPEKLEFRLDAATDSSKECVLEPSADYVLTADYAFELPLEFGEDFNIVLKDTLQGLPDFLGQAISNGRIKLAGNITSSLPLGLDLSINMLDSEGNIVPLAEECGKQKIKPCNSDGSAQKTELELMLGLAGGAAKADVAAMELVFKATSAGVSGVPVTEESFLHAELKAVLPEGLTLDLGDLMEKEDEQ